MRPPRTVFLSLYLIRSPLHASEQAKIPAQPFLSAGLIFIAQTVRSVRNRRRRFSATTVLSEPREEKEGTLAF